MDGRIHIARPLEITIDPLNLDSSEFGSLRAKVDYTYQTNTCRIDGSVVVEYEKHEWQRFVKNASRITGLFHRGTCQLIDSWCDLQIQVEWKNKQPVFSLEHFQTIDDERELIFRFSKIIDEDILAQFADAVKHCVEWW